MLVNNRKGATQLRDFSGLQFGGTRYPTDVDGFMELSDKWFVFIETKRGNALLPQGQRLALERLCDAVAETGRQCIVLVAEHHDDKDIDVANAMVREYRVDGQWRPPKFPVSVRIAMMAFFSWEPK